MHQLSLLDPPFARRRDPETSHVAAAEFAPRVNLYQSRMLDVFRCYPGSTAAEAARECVKLWSGLAESYRKRVSQLIDKGLLTRCTPRACDVTRHLAATYRVTN